MTGAEALIRRLRVHNTLSARDVAALQNLPISETESAARADILREGDRPQHCFVVISGFVCRSRNTADGKRQILSTHIPGDIPDLQSLYLEEMDHDIWSASPCTLGFISHDSLHAICALHPTITIALWRETLIDAAIFREWIVNVGRRDALGAMAHFLLEQAKRLQAVGLGSETEFELPLTQGDLADVLGLTPIHVNRVLRSLRERAIVRVIKQRVQILDLPRMKEIAGFESSYLHEGPRS